MRDYQACHCCGQIHRVPHLEPSQVASCVRCGARFTNPHEADRTAIQTAASAVGADKSSTCGSSPMQSSDDESSTRFSRKVKKDSML